MLSFPRDRSVRLAQTFLTVLLLPPNRDQFQANFLVVLKLQIIQSYTKGSQCISPRNNLIDSIVMSE